MGAPFNTPGTDSECQNLPVPFSWRQGRSLTDEVFIITIFLFVACVYVQVRMRAVASGAQAAAEIPTNVAHEYSTAALATLCSH